MVVKTICVTDCLYILYSVHCKTFASVFMLVFPVVVSVSTVSSQ